MAIRASDTLGRMTDRPPLELLLGDVVRLRRTHPCGGDEWQIDRIGADIGLRCRRCGRHVMIERRTLERRISSFVERGDLAMTAAVAPHPRDGAADPAMPVPPDGHDDEPIEASDDSGAPGAAAP
jgi:hypothetical protein